MFGLASTDLPEAEAAMQDPAFLRSCMRLYQGALKPDAPLVTFPSFNQRHLGDPCEAEKPTEGLLGFFLNNREGQ